MFNVGHEQILLLRNEKIEKELLSGDTVVVEKYLAIKRGNTKFSRTLPCLLHLSIISPM